MRSCRSAIPASAFRDRSCRTSSDKFRQADASFTRPHGGLGLGLAIARHLIELHGGSIEVRSAGEGTGATFVVRLPYPAPG
jgi:signal transduction histidine kinase